MTFGLYTALSEGLVQTPSCMRVGRQGFTLVRKTNCLSLYSLEGLDSRCPVERHTYGRPTEAGSVSSEILHRVLCLHSVTESGLSLLGCRHRA